MGKKDIGLKIPVLEKDHYFHWKVKMKLHLLSLDESYVNCIEIGPHVLEKTVSGIEADGSIRADKIVPKAVSEFTLEDIEKVHMDKKAMNILFNVIDQDMFENVINYNTSKKVWDNIQTLGEGSEQIWGSKMQFLVQYYEHFQYIFW